MKRILIIALIFILLLLCSCQPTPETEIIENKGSQESTGDQQNATEERFLVPEKWTDSYDYFDGKLNVNINADIVAPQVKSFKKYMTMPIEYTQLDAENMIRVFLGDAELTVEGQQWTKSQLEELLVKFKASYTTENNAQMTQELYEKSVQDLEERIAKAPETAVALNPTKQIEAFFESGQINLLADLGKDEKANVKIVNSDEGYGSYAGFFNNNGRNYGAVPMDNCNINLSISQEDAQQQATALLHELNINYMEMMAVKIGFAYDHEGDAIENKPQCYLLYFTRAIDGVSTTYDDRGGDATDLDQYDRIWPYERIVIGVDDGGIIQFSWVGSSKIIEAADMPVKLISFDQIMNIFNENMGINYAYTDETVLNSTYYVTEITLGLTRIKNENGYVLVPAWDFFGRVETTTSEETMETILDGTGKNQSRLSFLTINAVDGSVINRSIGY